eukprot:jgi/Chrzof1/9843/Cz04g18020.t1
MTVAMATSDADDVKLQASSSNIDIFLRVKPVPKQSTRLLIDAAENNVEFNIPRDLAAGPINNTREHYKFQFNGVLTPEAKQDEVFQRVARSVISGAMDGFNGTIFAYGQTGSGKTFTITGGPERYVDRGIIPRTISAIYSEAAKRGDYSFQVHISYLEIYNEVGYDLLDPNRDVKAMEDLPQVYIQEDEEQHIHYKNLSVHRAGNEEDALNLLFLGDTNRTISETPMNQASSRSHCIFTVHIEARKAGEDIVRRSKLNLVDLAGSERAAKTGIDGTTLREAKYINLSLHYLEQVIVALQERSMGLSRGHVPYRNSLMTTVLRDSLGGNCRTVMVATITGQNDQLDESISTCRFAQRVAMVKNQVSINEEVDPAAIIKRLKQEVGELRDEVRMLKGGGPERGPLTPDELQRLAQQVKMYCADDSPDASLSLAGDMMFIRASFDIFRQLVRQSGALAAAAVVAPTSGSSKDNSSSKDGSAGSTATAGPVIAGVNVTDLQEQLRKLKLQVQQRDNEIGILVGMLKRREAAGGQGPTLSGGATAAAAATAAAPNATATTRGSEVATTSGSDTNTSTSSEVLSALLNTNLLADRNKAFELFRKSYRQNEVIEENKAMLKAKYEQAKAMGAAVNASKDKINEYKAVIQQRRIQKSVAGVAEGADPEAALSAPDPEEEKAKELIEQEKEKYKDAFAQLRDLKGEIEHLQLLLEQSRQRVQKDFQQWMSLMLRQQQQHQQQQQQQQASNSTLLTGGSGRPPSGRQPSQVPPAAAGGAGYASPVPAPRQAWGPASPVHSLGGTTDTPLLPDKAAPRLPGHPQHMGGSPLLTNYPGSQPGSSLSAASSQPWTAGGAAYSNGHAPLDLSAVDPDVLAAARPHLTGNVAADQDIIKFYEARQKLLQKLNR